MTGIRVRIDTDIAQQAALSARIARGRADIAQQKRVQVASDDPAAARRIAQLRQTQVNETVWRGNIEASRAIAARADGALEGVAALLDRARELATLAVSDTLNVTDRATISDELRGIADEIDTIAATNDATGQPVFPSVPLRIPVAANLTLVATPSFTSAFVVGTRPVATLLRDAASGIGTSTTSRAVALSDIVASANQIAVVRGEQGARADRVERLVEQSVDTSAAIVEERSALEDTDIAATIARIQGDQLALDAAQSAFARVNRRTLFDLLA